MDGTVSVTMLDAVTSAISVLLEWMGLIINSLLNSGGSLNPLLPLFAIGEA